MKSLQEFPRIPLAVLPTPIQRILVVCWEPMCGSNATI